MRSYTSNPLAGVAIVDRSKILGINTPLLVLVTSNAELISGFGIPIPICENRELNAPNATAMNNFSVFIFVFGFGFICYKYKTIYHINYYSSTIIEHANTFIPMSYE
ncbi:hypothetical protein EMIT036CA2_40118 [Chryseobacterium sp. IT-36CA2]